MSTLTKSGLLIHLDSGNRKSYKNEVIDIANSSSSSFAKTRVFRNIHDEQICAYADYELTSIESGSLRLSTKESGGSLRLYKNDSRQVAMITMWLKLNSMPLLSSSAFVFDARTTNQPSNFYLKFDGSSNLPTAENNLIFYDDQTNDTLTSETLFLGSKLNSWRCYTFMFRKAPIDFTELVICKGLDVNIGPILLYDRLLNGSETQTNFNFYRNRFISNPGSSFPYKEGLIGYFNLNSPATYSQNLAPNPTVNLTLTEPSKVSFLNNSVMNLGNNNTSDNSSAIVLSNLSVGSGGMTISFPMFALSYDTASEEKVLLHVSSLEKGILSSNEISNDIRSISYQILKDLVFSFDDLSGFSDLESQLLYGWTYLTLILPSYFQADNLVLFARKNKETNTYQNGFDVHVGPILVYDGIVSTMQTVVNVNYILERYFPRSNRIPVPDNIEIGYDSFLYENTNDYLLNNQISLPTNACLNFLKQSTSVPAFQGMYVSFSNTCKGIQSFPKNLTTLRPAGTEPSSRRIACLNEGEKVAWNCTKIPADIDHKFGLMQVDDASLVDEVPIEYNIPENCRALALQSPDKYYAWGLRPGYCVLYKKEVQNNFFGDNFEKINVTGCLRPGEKLEWACQTSEPELSLNNSANFSSTTNSSNLLSSSLSNSTFSGEVPKGSTEEANNNNVSSSNSTSTSRSSNEIVFLNNSTSTSTSTGSKKESWIQRNLILFISLIIIGLLVIFAGPLLAYKLKTLRSVNKTGTRVTAISTKK